MMNSREAKSLTLPVFLFCCLILLQSCNDNETKEATIDASPNIIIILADDLGIGDVSFFNKDSKISTANIDSLAKRSISFTDAHSGSSVCTPTRYGLLTGRYSWRSTLKSGVTWSYDDHIIDSSRMTVASYLKGKGYNTACIGKWHLGVDWARDALDSLVFTEPIKNGPNTLGFDYFYGIAASLDIPPYFYIENDKITATEIDTVAASPLPEFWRTGPIGNDFKHVEVLPKITQKATEYIEEHANKANPFFLYFPLPAPHTPILPTEAFEGKSQLTSYADFVLMVDDVVGQILSALDNSGIRENTIVVFTSDNGFAPYADFEAHESAGHYPSYLYRGYKSDIYEGGHRMPFIFSWPNKIKEARTIDQTICLTDMLATVAALFGETLPPNAGEDSYNILPALMHKDFNESIREGTVHHSIEGCFSIRQADWKLVFCPGSGGWSSPTTEEVETGTFPPVQLFNLKDDLEEITNVANEFPEIVNQLTQLMESYVKNGRSTPGEPQQNEGETFFIQ
ncbi:MAG: arylsulfatase [Bacteroidetes bacterium]|nr:arylsulfatase [Bacteroidota bacterium]MDA1120055.1 arylsulfatase [Bacteroidota bacterium]